MLTHCNKTHDVAALTKVLGSVDFVNLPRSVLIMANEPGRERRDGRRVIAHAKCNLAREGESLALEVSGGGVHYLGKSQHEANDLFEAPRKRGEKSGQAVAWLAHALRNGAVPEPELVERAKASGIKQTTLRRAMTLLGAVSQKSGFGSGWEWTLPPEAQPLLPPGVP